MSDQPTVPAAGWYPDPTAATPGTLRWWNGAGWSTEVRAAKPAASTPAPLPPVAALAQAAPAAPVAPAAPLVPPYATGYPGAAAAPAGMNAPYGTPPPARPPHAGAPAQPGYAGPGYLALPSYPGNPGAPAQGYEAGPYAGYGTYTGTAPLVGPGEPKSFTGAISSVLKQYASFGGRASRSEFWYWTLFTSLASIVLWAVVLVVVIAGAAAAGNSSGSAAFAGVSVFTGIVYLLWIGLALAVMLPTLAVSVRRLRDAGLHWAWIFISFVPGGSIALIVFWCQPSKPWALPRS